MPVPKPRLGETKEKFIPRCISTLRHIDKDSPAEQIAAMCFDAWDRFSKLEQVLPARYLVQPHAKLIWEGKKTLIISTKPCPPEYFKKPIYFMQDRAVYGILQITKVTGPLSADRVRKELRHRHQISDEEWSRWAKAYPQWNKEVFVFEFKVLEKFRQPKDFEPQPGVQDWVKRVYLISKEDLAELDFLDNNLAPVFGSGIETRELPIQAAKEIIPKLKPFYFMRPAIYVVGGSVIKKEGSKHDVEWLINYSTRIEERDGGVEFRIGRQFPDLSENFEYIYRRIAGPFTDYVQAYDFVAVPSKFKDIIRMENMQEIAAELAVVLLEESFVARLEDSVANQVRLSKQSGTVRPLEFVLPAKPVIGHKAGERYTLQAAIDMVTPNKFPVHVDKKYDGNWLQLSKSGDVVKIFRDRGQDCSAKLPETVKELQSWPQKVLTIFSDTERWTEDGEYIGRELVAGYLSGKGPVNDEGILHNVFDIAYIEPGPGDVHKLVLTERRQLLKKLPIKQSTGEVPSIKTAFNLAPWIVCETSKELESAIKKVSKFPASEGAVIKEAKSEYPLGGAAYDWVKYKRTADIKAIILKILPTKISGINRYRVGLKIPSGWTAMRLSEDKKYMDIGKTLSGKHRFAIGDIVIVNFEELFFYKDPTTNERQVVVYIPNIVSTGPEKGEPDSAEQAIEIAGDAGNLVQKSAHLSYVRQELIRIKKW